MNTKISFVTELQNAFPTVAGVGPSGFSRRDLERELRFTRMPITDVQKMVSSIINTANAARQVGLILTVNGISRVVRECAESYSQDKKSGQNSRPFPAIYKGVSFNPQTYGKTRGRGEWIVIFDFYSILRSIINQNPINPPKFFILDAGFYWIANLLGNTLAPNANTSDAAASQILEKLADALKQKKFKEVIITNRVRNAYLRAIAERFPANCTPPVFSLKDVWFDPEFLPFLSGAITLFCKKNSKNNWTVRKPVSYERYMAYSPWVTPLAAAETIFIGEKLKIRGILSPTAEAAWNKINDQFSRMMNTVPFISWMYVRKLGKVLSYQSIPFLSDDEKTIEQKLRYAQNLDPTTPDLIAGLISPFIGKQKEEIYSSLRQKDIKKVSQFIASFLNPIEKRASDLYNEGVVPTTPLDQIGWLSQFPPGIC